MKLYKHVNRLRFLKWVPRKLHPGLRWALGLKPGDMINDCSGFNVVIARADPEVYHTNKGWYIYDVIFTNEHGGCCSLRNCGVSPPLSVADIEKYKRQFYDSYEVTEDIYKATVLHMAVIRYSDGDTFGHSSGHWHVVGFYHTLEQADRGIENA